ncbi:MAG: UTP--glucose-1-phosphate uridylyltransferase [Lachnospiraceae bacterium]|nr:UTP--glucose-1-phosphate uridylyltransferase [Lachnospiraceae bacterium]MBQ9609892.1 UTP--glucose-1-phosphate uridylyltransferase [Lachnospiraceae bacterium]
MNSNINNEDTALSDKSKYSEKFISDILEKCGQDKLFTYYNNLNPNEKIILARQIEDIDWSFLEPHKSYASDKNISPINIMSVDNIKEKKDEYSKIGIKSIQEGKLALVLLAGGQGTRLGYDHPKGMFDVGISKSLYIFEALINNTMKVVEQAGCFIPFYIMTSSINNDETIAFFKEHDYFGYNPEYITFFVQESNPVTDFEGNVLLSDRTSLCISPNGNGGWFSSMDKNGLLHTILDSPVEWINVFSVDNVLQGIADPVFLGATIDSGLTCGAKVVAKAAPDEKVGAICSMNGRPHIIEYYELSQEMMNEKNPDGTYAYGYGVILNYLFPVKKLTRTLNSEMPLHIVKKAVPYMDYDGNFISSDEVNAFKYETLALDLIHAMDTCLAYEIERDKEFAPIKNKSGIDSIDTARELLIKNGVEL